MDFECEFNLHSYGARLCLIQIFDGSRYFIIDPFCVSSGEIAKLLENKRIIKLFFAASSDKSLLYKQYGIVMKSVYDQLLLVEALDFQERGLDNVLKKVLGITVKNKKKYQQYNWTLRPVREDAMQYALSDVQYLFELNSRLLGAVMNENKYEELILKFVQSEFDFSKTSTPGMFKTKNYKRLDARQKERFKKLVVIRDKIAEKLNYPPNNVISNEKVAMLALDPGSLVSLQFGRGVGPEHIRMLRQQILDLESEQ